MQNTITPFDPKQHHIYIPFFITIPSGRTERLIGILDTGAPRTEFSDSFLVHMGLIKKDDRNIQLKPDMQTQKYGKVILPTAEICGQKIEKFEVFVSRLDTSWGVAALIGLDFFRKFRVTIDYKLGEILTEVY